MKAFQIHVPYDPHRLNDLSHGGLKFGLKCERRGDSFPWFETRTGVPIAEWPQKVLRVLRRLPGRYKGEILHGIYTGPIEPGCPYKGLPYVPHSWAVMLDGSVLDPIRWYFDQTAPRLFIGKSNDYDYNGLEYRKRMADPPPVHTSMNPLADLKVSKELAAKLRFLLLGCRVVDIRQLHWLCRQPPDIFDNMKLEFYEAVYTSAYHTFLSTRTYKRIFQ